MSSWNDVELVKYHRVEIHSDRYKKKKKLLWRQQQTNNFKPWQTFHTLVASSRVANSKSLLDHTFQSGVCARILLLFFIFLKKKRKSVFSVLFPLALPAGRRRGVRLSFHMKKEPWWCRCSPALALMRMRCFVFRNVLLPSPSCVVLA